MNPIQSKIRIDINSVEDIMNLFERNIIDIVQFDNLLAGHALALSIRSILRKQNDKLCGNKKVSK